MPFRQATGRESCWHCRKVLDLGAPQHVCPETIQIGDVVVYDPVHDETPIVVETEDDVNFYRSEGSELVAIYRHPEWRR